MPIKRDLSDKLVNLSNTYIFQNIYSAEKALLKRQYPFHRIFCYLSHLFCFFLANPFRYLW